VQDVKLHFSPKRLPYVVTKPLHESQKLLSQDQDGGTIQIKVVPNLELEQLLLSFGEDITVLYPISLRNRINSRLGSACENYSQVDTKRKNSNG
jgi:predicted DNA-binding transcriptional regulator YafY